MQYIKAFRKSQLAFIKFYDSINSLFKLVFFGELELLYTSYVNFIIALT